MNKQITWKLYALFIFQISSGITASCEVRKDSLKYKLNSYFTALANSNLFNGSVIISKKGERLLNKTYNITGVPDSLKVSAKSKFIIASLSKAFIKVAILKLAEQGKLKLTDTIGKYIAGFTNGNKITIEQLMFHKSGLPREITNYENYQSISLLQAIELAKKERLLFEPDTETAYSNIGYFLLHFIISKVSNNGYFSYMQHEIFNKLKLKNTFEYNYAKSKQFFVHGFTNENEQLEAAETKTINQFETGNIITTINDLYTFCQKITDTDFLNSKSRNLLFHTDSLFFQAGGRKGYRSYLQINRKNNSVFIFLSNQTNIPFDEIVKEINNIIENRPFLLPQISERKEITVPIETLNNYVGTYVSNEQKLQVTVMIMDSHLVAVEKNNIQTKLFAETENSFFDSPKSKDTYSFISNEKNEITAMLIVTNGIKIKLERQK
jgi:CubicO group peptidase (beta-lactamase class C family)